MSESFIQPIDQTTDSLKYEPSDGLYRIGHSTDSFKTRIQSGQKKLHWDCSVVQFEIHIGEIKKKQTILSLKM